MKTMLDKCAVAGDVTQAIDRRGAWSCAVTVIGGTENTAVKLQSADSADGEFTDFKTLISADEAEADQYKGFVLDLSGAGNFIKIVGATMATCVLGDCDHDVKTVAIKAGEIPSGADLENNKTATINVSTYTEPVEITPTEGKDGMKKATITLSNIPSGSGLNMVDDCNIPIVALYPTGEGQNTRKFVLYDENGNFIDYADKQNAIGALFVESRTSGSVSYLDCETASINEDFDVVYNDKIYTTKNESSMYLNLFFVTLLDLLQGKITQVQ